MANFYGKCFIPKLKLDAARTFSTVDDQHYVIDWAEREDEGSCRELVSESRDWGDNVDVSELLEDEELDVYLFGQSNVFAVRRAKRKEDCERQRIVAFIAILPSVYSGSWDLNSQLARIYIFRAEHLRHDLDFYRHLLRLSVLYTAQLNIGYTRSIVCIARSLPQLVQVARQEGFVVVATIPDGVNLAKRGVGEDLIMVNSIGVINRAIRSSEEMNEVLIRSLKLHKSMPSYNEEWLPISFLPLTYIFSSGLRTIIRTMEEKDVAICYSMLKSAADDGLGYGIHECPTLEAFRTFMLRKHYCIVIAMEQGEISCTDSTRLRPETLVGFFLMTDSVYSRNAAARLSESFLVIGKEFRGRGLGREVSTMDLALKKELGFVGSLDDTVFGNTRMLRLFKGNEYSSVIVGVIPDGSVMVDGRSEDQVLVLFDIVRAGNKIKTMTEMSRESLNLSSKHAMPL